MKSYQLILSISKTHLLSRIKQSSIAALGVTFGIGTFIILVSFMTGLNGLLDGLILNRTPHVHIYNEIEPSTIQPIDQFLNHSKNFTIVQSIKPKQSLSKIHNALPLMAYLEKNTAVLGVTSQVQAKVFYMAGTVELGGVINGVNPVAENRLFNFNEYITKGKSENLLKNNQGILLGAGIAKKLKLDINDRITLSTPKGDLFPLIVVGIFQSGLANIDDIQSYVNTKTAQQILGESNSYITDINIKLKDINKAVPFSKMISNHYKVKAVDINTANAQFETGTKIRNIITYAVSITLLIVAGFGIYNILNMLIYEKMNDIAILKAIGFSGKDVQQIFISQAMIIGFVGGILGIVIGFVVSVIISHTPFKTEALPTIETFPVNFDPKFYVIAVIFSLGATFLAGYLPAKKAKNIDPVQIIRGQ